MSTPTEANLHEHCGLWTLEIVTQLSRSRAKNAWYRVTPLASDFGPAFRLNAACGCTLAAGAESYDVAEIDGHWSCECLGALQHGHCKHTWAVAKLVAEGKLPGRSESLPAAAASVAHHAACESHRGGDCDCFPVAAA